ncbi:MAG: glycoside hydrolase family 13 protein [Chloroflexi bacterium]|nr:glycoside hydrolase family 13 protein [Chloroflexota bacterium]MBU1751372.1 glycoside hydrolase family 13 protein [Chloroflexota bacterium]
MENKVRLVTLAVAFTLILGSMVPALAWGSPPANPPTAPSLGSANCDIQWGEVLHDTFDSDYRSIVGPTTPGNTVKLRLRVAQSDITSARVRVWDDRTNTQTYHDMAWDGGFDTDATTYDWWYADIAVGSQPTILYYFFEINDAGGACGPPDQDFYVDDDVKFYGGGTGAMSDGYDDSRSFQITVYDAGFDVPEWMQRGVVYQIFPDRFRDGDASNNPAAGRFAYDRTNGAITRSQFDGNNSSGDWNYTVCDPRGLSGINCSDIDGGFYGDNFYGGDLQGIIDKIDQGYFDNLGVSVLYLNPIFRSPSNHKYDTADYLTIDPDFGDLADFQDLVAAANDHGIQIILDGVFNHTSSDSTYFDYYSRYDAGGNLTSPSGPGTDDNSGGCEGGISPYYSWFYFPATGNPGGSCNNGVGDAPQTYEAWYGYGSLPKLQANSTNVRDLIWNDGLNSVGPYWVDQGARGWRFDVGGDVDPGLTNDPTNDYWEGFRTAVRAATVSGDTVTLGEEWGDASAWLLGHEWDSVMNYRFRSALLSWLFTGCSGDGCSGGTAFEDNDSNSGSSSGSISIINSSQFNARLLSIWEDYPPMALKAMMNLEGSHDTNRLRFLLKKTNNDSDSDAVQRMKEWWLFAFTYPGAPTLYYGDEIGLNHDGVWASGKWEDDPYNRVPYPWPDASGSTYSYDATAQSADLQGFARHMASTRWSYRTLQDGDVQHGLIINDANKLYGFARTGSPTALIALNRDTSSHSATFSGLNAAPYNLVNGTVLVNALDGATYTVSGGSVMVSVNATWGVVLLEQNQVETPAAPGDLSVERSGADVTLTWPSVTEDTGGGRELVTYYTIHRDSSSSFTPDAGNQIGIVYPPTYGSADSLHTYTDSGAPVGEYYSVCAYNAPGKCSCSTPQVPTAVGLTTVATAPARGVEPLGIVLVAILVGLGAALPLGVWLLRRWRQSTNLPQAKS